jgi:hypothetical protein
VTGPLDPDPSNLKTAAAIEMDGSDCFHVTVSGGERLLTSIPLEWETDFFGRSMRRLDLVAKLSAAHIPDWTSAVDAALSDHDARRVAITQVNLDFAAFELLCHLEARGFRSVDSRAEFVTLISPERLVEREPPFGAVVDLTEAHLEDVITLVHMGFTRNPKFQSRFKNREWFSAADTDRYYEAWIRNTVNDPRSLGAVWIHEDRTLGFFLYQRAEDRDGAPQYKGVLAAVVPEHRGHGAHLFLQSYLYTRMPPRVWLDNTTQLSNRTVIRNHMESGKRLESLSIVLYRSGSDEPPESA